MPISSMVVRVQSGRGAQVASRIAALPSAEVTDIQGHELVVVSDTANREEDRRIWEEIEGLDNVLSTALVYHNFEDLDK